MPASKTMLTGGSFQDSLGNPLANGTLKFHLSQDCLVSGVGTVCSGIDVIIQLDSTGNVASSASTPSAPNQYIWSNLVMTPQNNYYRVTGYTAQGQIAFGGNNQQVGSGATFNLDNWTPNTVLSWFPSTQQAVLLEVNGTPTAVQTIANFESTDSSVTITDEGNGSINFQTAGGSKPFPNGGILGLWPGNWLGFNAAAVSGENVQKAGIGAAWTSTAAGIGTVPPTAIQPQSVNNNAGDSSLINSSGISDLSTDLTTGILQDWFAKVALLGNTGARYWVGATDLAPINQASGFNTDTPAANFIGFRYSTGTDTHIVAICQTDATHQMVVDTGIFPTFSTTPQVFEMVPTASGTTINFYINGTLVATISSNVPANTTAMGSLVTMDAQDNGSSNAVFNLFYIYFLINS
jgi:hypothetical protein